MKTWFAAVAALFAAGDYAGILMAQYFNVYAALAVVFAVLMAAAMVFTMAGCGSSKDADTSAKKETKTEDSKDKENSDKQFIVCLLYTSPSPRDA